MYSQFFYTADMDRYEMVWAVVLLMTGKYSVQVNSMITCDAPTVEPGDPASITCHFDVDVSVAKKNIKVQRQPLTSDGFDPDTLDTVLDCHWQNALDLSCQFGHGFKLVGEPGETAVIHIASATKEDEQFYFCEVVPSDPANIQSCKLTVRDKQAWNGNVSLPVYLPGLLEDEIAATKGIVTAIVIIVIIICIITVLLLVLLLILFRKKLKENIQTCCKRVSSRKSPHSKKDIEDQTTVPMLTRSENQGGNQPSSAMDSKKKALQESDIKHVPNVKAVSVQSTGEGARASETKIKQGTSESQESREHKLPTDPKGLQISVEEWYIREEAEVNRKIKEIQALKQMYAAKEEHEQANAIKKEHERKCATDSNKDVKQMRELEENEKFLKEKRREASSNLETVRKKHDEERKRQEEEDRTRLKSFNLSMQPAPPVTGINTSSTLSMQPQVPQTVSMVARIRRVKKKKS